jgi:hypothetical protein
MFVPAPISSGTLPLDPNAQVVWQTLDKIPTQSKFSVVGNNPNSFVTGVSGDLATSVSASNSSQRWWGKAGGALLPSKTSWLPFAMISAVGGLSSNTLTPESGATITALAALSTNTIIAQSGNTVHVLSDVSISGQLISKVGSSASLARPVQVLHQATGMQTTSTATVSLSTFTLAASSLGVNGNALRFTLGPVRATTATGLYSIMFGATRILTDVQGTVAAAAAHVHGQVNLVRTGAATQRASGVLFAVGPATGPVAPTAPTETLANQIPIVLQGRVLAGGTLDFDNFQIELLTL